MRVEEALANWRGLPEASSRGRTPRSETRLLGARGAGSADTIRPAAAAAAAVAAAAASAVPQRPLLLTLLTIVAGEEGASLLLWRGNLGPRPRRTERLRHLDRLTAASVVKDIGQREQGVIFGLGDVAHDQSEERDADSRVTVMDNITMRHHTRQQSQ